MYKYELVIDKTEECDESEFEMCFSAIFTALKDKEVVNDLKIKSYNNIIIFESSLSKVEIMKEMKEDFDYFFNSIKFGSLKKIED